MMNPIKGQLAKLENRLQTLIEESTTRILPLKDNRNNIGAQLVAAMHANIQSDETGDLIAPDLYILLVDPETAHLLEEEKGLPNELSELIIHAGSEAGVRFLTPPRIKISADESIGVGQLEITPSFSLNQIDETSTLTISSEAGNPIPEHAFLVIDGVQIFPLTQPVCNVGRRVDNHVVLEDLRVSRVHAQIRVVSGRHMIFDLESSGGTFVNGVRVAQTTLFPGDVISLAGVDLVYGQDAALMSNDDPGSTQPLAPFPDPDS
jgi:pSer/pThr/pTyr-binding forkhead associated (FHA) protein